MMIHALRCKIRLLELEKEKIEIKKMILDLIWMIKLSALEAVKEMMIVNSTWEIK